MVLCHVTDNWTQVQRNEGLAQSSGELCIRVGTDLKSNPAAVVADSCLLVLLGSVLLSPTVHCESADHVHAVCRFNISVWCIVWLTAEASSRFWNPRYT